MSSYVGRDSPFGIATRNGMDGPGSDPGGGRGFAEPVQTCPVAHLTSYTMDTESLPGVKRPRRGNDHPPSSSAEVKEKVELYLYSYSGPSWPVLG